MTNEANTPWIQQNFHASYENDSLARGIDNKSYGWARESFHKTIVQNGTIFMRGTDILMPVQGD